jgi:two-component system, cell cycle response regulator
MRIVLVDPSRAVQRAMRDLIAQGGHEVLSFYEGQKALDCIKVDSEVRALITSVQLPDISGLQVCSAARRLAGSRRPLFIIVMSSTEDFGLVVKALDNGADDFIPKPPMVEELRARLRAADRLTSMQCELIKYATTDSLTGLFNRRAFLEDASEACETAGSNNPVSTILFDIDHFKSINDGHGHETGDVVLATVGTAAKMVANGTVGRLGGEEFCILERCDLAEAVELAEALRTSVKNLKFSKGDVRGITCSFGVAEWEPGDTIDRLLRRADIAMYEAKSAGRDRVVAADRFALADRRDGWRDVAVAAKRASG